MNGPQFGPRGTSYIRKNERTGQLGKSYFFCVQIIDGACIPDVYRISVGCEPNLNWMFSFRRGKNNITTKRPSWTSTIYAKLPTIWPSTDSISRLWRLCTKRFTTIRVWIFTRSCWTSK